MKDSKIASKEASQDPDALTGAPDRIRDVRDTGNLELVLFDSNEQQSASEAIRSTGPKSLHLEANES